MTENAHSSCVEENESVIFFEIQRVLSVSEVSVFCFGQDLEFVRVVGNVETWVGLC